MNTRKSIQRPLISNGHLYIPIKMVAKFTGRAEEVIAIVARKGQADGIKLDVVQDANTGEFLIERGSTEKLCYGSVTGNTPVLANVGPVTHIRNRRRLIRVDNSASFFPLTREEMKVARRSNDPLLNNR